MYRILANLLAIFTLPSYLSTHDLGRNGTSRRDQAVPQIPRIVVAPTDQYSTDGFLEFVCRAEGNPQPIIQWYNSSDKQLVTDRIPSAESLSGIHVNKHYGRLMISNPTRGVIYSFYCNASNEVGWTVSDRIVQGGAAFLENSFRRLPKNYTVNEGANLTMICEPPAGLPEPVVFWMRDGKPLGSSHENTTDAMVTNAPNLFLPNLMTVTPEGHLYIPQVQLTHSGRYICAARNLIAERYAPAVELTVKSSVTFIETPKHTRVRQGQTVTFRCQTDGVHRILWKRGSGEGVMDRSRTKIDQGHLTIRSVQMSDSGSYVCFVPNAGSHSATLTVDSPPAFVEIPTDLSVQIGQTVSFHCVAQGHPKPSIYWELPDKTPVFPSDSLSDQKYTVYSDGRLQITNVQSTDEGKYQCTAHSSVDTIHSTAKLRVLTDVFSTSAPDFTGRETTPPTAPVTNQPIVLINSPIPFISLPPCNQTRIVGESVLFTCDVGNRRSWKQAQSQPSWLVRWMKRSGSTDQPIESIHASDSHRFRVLRTGNLQISSLESQDSGLYKCIVYGSVNQIQGAESTSIHVRSEWIASLTVVPIRPSATDEQCQDIVLPSPRNLNVINVTATSVTLIWEPLQTYHTGVSSTSHQTIAYRVEYLSLSEPSNSWVTVERNWPMNNVHLAGLIPNTIYYFLVRSRWMNGRIGWSSDPLGPIHTPTTAVISNPSASLPFLKNYASNPTQIDLRERIKQLQIDHIQFQVLTDSQLHIQWTVTETATLLNFINGFTVRAQEVGLLRCVGSILEQNSESIHHDRTFSSRQTYCSLHYRDSEGLAGMVYRLEGLQRLYTESSTDANHPIMISTDISNLPRPTHSNEIGAHFYQGTLRNLRPFQCYEIRISAYIVHNSYGKLEGHSSAPKFVLTSERAPSAPPSAVSVAWVAKTRAHIRWNAPLVNSWNGLLTGYVVQIYGELTQEPQIINVSHSILSIDVDLLPRPEAYLVQIAAVTCSGVGVPSSPIRLVPTTYTTYVNASTDLVPKGNKTVELLAQPWFVGTMIGSIVAWCIIIALVAFFCFRKRYKKSKTTCTVSAPTEVSRSQPGITKHDPKLAAFGLRVDNVKLEPLLLSETRHGTEQASNHHLSESTNVSFIQSRSYAEYLVQSRATDQIGTRRKQIDSRSNDSHTGVGTQSISSSGGRSSNDALHQPMLVTSTHGMSSPEQVDALNHVGIPQSYSLSPSQYGWQSSPGAYPHDMLPPFQMSSGAQSTVPYRPTGFPPFWPNTRNGSIDRADGDSENLYFRSTERSDDGTGATPYATASILSATERNATPGGCLIPKVPLSTICNAGAMCYPCVNAQSSSDQASYTSNSDRFRTRPNRGYMNNRYEENGMTQSYPAHNHGENTPSRKDTSSKASRSPTTSISRSSSKQQNKSQITSLTNTTTMASAEHSLTSSHVTPQDEELSMDLPNNNNNNGPVHGEPMNEEPVATGKHPYLPHFDPVSNSRDWTQSTRDNPCSNSVNQTEYNWNGEYPHA